MRLLVALALPSAVLAFSVPERNVELLSPTNATQLKAVFFSGDPWLVQCGSTEDLAAAAVAKGLSVHEVVELALPKLSPIARVGLLDCTKRLPSGKSTRDRFKLDAGIEPTLLMAANGQNPVQLTPSMLAKHGLGTVLFPSPRQLATALTALVRSRSEKKALSFTKSEHLHQHCLKRKYCALVLMPREISPQSDSARTLHKLLHEFRAVAFGTVNAARYDLSLAKHLPQPASPKQPQLVVFRSSSVEAAADTSVNYGKIPTSKAKKTKKELAVSAKAHRGEFSLPELRGFLKSLTADDLELTPLKKAPTIRWRRQEKAEKTGASKGGAKSTAGGGAGGGRRSARAGGSTAASASGGRQQQAGGRKAAPSSSGGDGEVSDEVKRRQKMAEEEEEYLRSMFGDAEEEGDGETDGADEEDQEEMVLDLDEDEGGSDEQEAEADADMKEEL